MAKSLRIGVQLPEVERRVSWPEYLTMARSAERAGFDSIWLGDHLLYRGDGREERGPWDVWSLLAALATTTSHIRLGPLVACTAFYRPSLLARRAAAVQEISRGRLVLGLGAGWNETEFRAFGIPFDHRASRFEEAFEIIRRLLAGERVTLVGRFEQVHDAVLLPRPSASPPLLIGSIGERILRATLGHVDAWNAWYGMFGNTAHGFARENARVSRLLRETGRDPGVVKRTVAVYVALQGGKRDRPHARDVPPIIGSPAQIARRLVEFAEAGADEAILMVSPINGAAIRALGDVVATVTRLTSLHHQRAAEVRPAKGWRWRVPYRRRRPEHQGTCSWVL